MDPIARSRRDRKNVKSFAKDGIPEQLGGTEQDDKEQQRFGGKMVLKGINQA